MLEGLTNEEKQLLYVSLYATSIETTKNIEKAKKYNAPGYEAILATYQKDHDILKKLLAKFEEGGHC
jgi:hypothetical protein